MLQLIRLLQDGRFHSGEALGAALGISRAAVWKQLRALEAELGVPVHKVRGRGYRLASPLRLLDTRRLSAGLAWPVEVLSTVDSTNSEALRRLEDGQAAPFVVLAEQQTAGRGRRGRIWVSPFAENLYYSLVLRVEGGMRQLEGLSLVVGLALLQAVRALGVAGAALKWPNDLLVDGRKIAGILLELSGDPADICHVVIGIGVNVNMRPGPRVVIDQDWTSMRNELGDDVDRNQLVIALSAQLALYLERHQSGGFSALLEEWQANHAWQGRRVVLTAGNQHIEGVVQGVDKTGAIRLLVDGVEQHFSGGELSLRLHHDS